MSLNQGIQKYKQSIKKQKLKNKKIFSKPKAVESPNAHDDPNKKSLFLQSIEDGSAIVLIEDNLVMQEGFPLDPSVDQGTKKTTAHHGRKEKSPLNSTQEELIIEYGSLIRYIAKKIASRLPSNIELDDLISSGVIGFMDAINKYDSGRDNKFKTYAEFRIRGSILDELRAQDWVPRSVREKTKLLERCYNKIEHEKGRQATEDEVCEELSISKEDFYQLLNQARSVSVLSYDDFAHFSNVDKKALHLGSENSSQSKNPFNEVSFNSIKRLIGSAIDDLPEKQKMVLSLYYFEDLNLKEIGSVLNVTESRVSQLHTQAVLKLKAKLKNNIEDFSSFFK